MPRAYPSTTESQLSYVPGKSGRGAAHMALSARWVLQAESELRFEVPEDSAFTCVLESGTAEIFGSELVAGREYTFTNVKLAVFTWYGAVLKATELEGGLLNAVLAVLHPVSATGLPPFSGRGTGKGKEGGREGGREGEEEEEEEDGEETLDPALALSNVAGFVHVTGVDVDRKKIRALAPCPGTLPSRYLVVGSLVWIEEGS
ncbi:hypothetical protein NSK_006189 [Nannochloropsis salina CCMP1776]|uniref:Clp1 N-terminal beta-sandwich domain-containing protein n=1 Tax=Nannochloropsis salina CCMP1776 TaxID=1027361 RepID=A0A4D9CTE9_9STRA|nr:hypothetical protein NSK_006189 [Nannochloropsis salina CCMP1776]|eukprot:TFJ82511.1 hypothetical protein NSK_006189 [Nannochloropsis salina CCMP1776]